MSAAVTTVVAGLIAIRQKKVRQLSHTAGISQNPARVSLSLTAAQLEKLTSRADCILPGLRPWLFHIQRFQLSVLLCNFCPGVSLQLCFGEDANDQENI